MKILSVGAELYHTDRRTDVTKLMVTFRNFAKASKNKQGKQFSNGARSCNHYCSGKSISIIYSECVAIRVYHAMRMRHIVICGLSGSTVFFTLSHKWHDFRTKKVIVYKIFPFSLQLLSETLLIIRRTEWDLWRNIGLRVKYPLFMSDFYETWISQQIFGKYLNIKCYENPFTKSRVPCGRTNRRTARHDEANSCSTQSSECDKKVSEAGFVSVFSLKYHHVSLVGVDK
jgi:hypothetical protein